jgi:hypothetical protein
LQRVIEARKAHKLAKEEKERYELLAKKMHAKVSLFLQLRSYTKELSLTYYYRKSSVSGKEKRETNCSRSVSGETKNISKGNARFVHQTKLYVYMSL